MAFKFSGMGEWIGVEPLSQGLVVNIGYQLQVHHQFLTFIYAQNHKHQSVLGLLNFVIKFWSNCVNGMQIISNGKLKCAEHRAVTNSSNARMSAGFFITPSPDCYIEPASALINASNPQLYKGFQYKEYVFCQLLHEAGKNRSCSRTI